LIKPEKIRNDMDRADQYLPNLCLFPYIFFAQAHGDLRESGDH
jgi:hypothetical protein